MSINERIKILRKDQGLNQIPFGEKIGLKKAAASKIEREGNTITERNIQIICSTFNVSRAWLERGEGEMYLPKPEPSAIEALTEEYNLTAERRALVEAFLSLPKEYCEAILDASRILIETAQKAGYPVSVPEDAESVTPVNADVEKASIDSKVEAYRKELEAEAKGKTSSASPTGSSPIENRA